MFARDVIEAIGAAAADIGIEPAALLAVAEVESGGVAYALVNGRREPLIRFEGHYFDRLLAPARRAVARSLGLASPVAGGVRNPASQGRRWRLVRRAAAIDRDAAYQSVSWGLGQVMGEHWRPLGYPDVDALVAEARSGAGGQARLMARYVAHAGLAAALCGHDWTAFARGYNGPLYARSGYDRKIAAAYRRYGADDPRPPVPSASIRPLRRGDSGEAVRDLQMALAALDHGTTADGVFGAATERAVKAFQRASGLAADGIAGPATRAALARQRGGE
jgi:hypothetical protein